MEFEAVIGMEVHVEINSRSKVFCACSTDFHAPPNTNVCPVCLGMPGALPVLNRDMVEKSIMVGLALNCQISRWSKMDRKNYFYPDLAKNYQISQYDLPLCHHGWIDIEADGETRRIRITRAHMEEDTARNTHTIAGGLSGVDFNRSGVPLLEIVTEPDIRSAREAYDYLTALKQLLQYLDVSDCNMEEGSLRAEANVSVRPVGSDRLGTKTEIKNVNSIEAVRDAIEKEIERQAREMEAGRRIEAWTLEWDEDAGVLRKMRSKETEADYRYFREPDLLPLRLDEQWKQSILSRLPELPLERRARFVEQYGLPEYDADILTGERSLSDYFEAAVKAFGGDPKKVSNYLMNDVLRMINESGKSAAELRLTPAYLAQIIQLAERGTINTTTAKSLLQKVEESGEAPQVIVEREGLAKVSDEGAIRVVCEQVLAANPKEVESYRAGKTTLIGWFVGQVMRQMGGKADPNLARRILEELLHQS